MGQILREGNQATSRLLMHTSIIRIEVTKNGRVLYYTLPFAPTGVLGVLRGPPPSGV